MYPVPWASFGAGDAGGGRHPRRAARPRADRARPAARRHLGRRARSDRLLRRHRSCSCSAKQGEAASADSRAATAASRYGVLVGDKDGRFIQTSTLLPHQGEALMRGRGHRRSSSTIPRFTGCRCSTRPRTPRNGRTCCSRRSGERDLADWLPAARGQPGHRLRGRGHERGGPRPPADRAQRRRDHRRRSGRRPDPRGRPDRPLRGDSGCRRRPAPALGDHNGPFVARRRRPLGGADAPAHPFAGVTIVEFGYFYAMPYGGHDGGDRWARASSSSRTAPATRTACRSDPRWRATRRPPARRASPSTSARREGRAIAQTDRRARRRVRHRLPLGRRREARPRLRRAPGAQPAPALRARARATAPTGRTRSARSTPRRRRPWRAASAARSATGRIRSRTTA